MAVYTRWTAAKFLRLDGEHVLRVCLGAQIVWDGTVPANVSVPRATATAMAVPPTVSSTPAAIVVPAAVATAAAAAPALSGGSSIAVPMADVLATAAAPAVRVDAVVLVPTASAGAEAIPIVTDAEISVPPATAIAEAIVPTIATTGSQIVVVPVAQANADAVAPIVAASKSIVAPVATVTADATAAVVSAGASVAVPTATASAVATAPAVAAINFQPSGMTKNGSVAWAGSATWVTITNWTANTGTYPGSSVDGSHRLVIQGSKTNASISGQAAYTGGGFARTHSIRVIDQAGNVIATGAPNTNTSGNCTVSATGVDLTGVTALALQMSGDFSAGTLSSGASTFLTVT